MYSLMGRIVSDGAGAVTQAEGDRGDALYGVSGLVQIVTLLATAVVFIVWFHRARVNAEVFAPHAFTKGRGWAIGAWFVPIGNLFLPRRIVREIWDASAQAAPDGSWRQVSQVPLSLWWSLWIASTVFGRIAGSVHSSAEDADASLGSMADSGKVGDVVHGPQEVRTVLVRSTSVCSSSSTGPARSPVSGPSAEGGG
jgi:hypothetical protein